MVGQVLNLLGGCAGVLIASSALGWLVHYAFSEEMTEKEESDEVEVDDNNENN